MKRENLFRKGSSKYKKMFPTLALAFIALIISLAVLIKGSSLFLDGASKIAKHLGVSEFLIGFTLVSIGTSLPELATSVTASIAKTPAIIMGNITGSNVANIGLILGLALIFLTIRIRKHEFERVYIMLLAVLLFALFASDLIISRFEAVILLVSFLLYFGGIFKVKEKFKHYKDYFSYFLELRGLLSLKKLRELKRVRADIKDGRRLSKKLVREAYLYQMVRESAVIFLGLILLALGGRFTIISAIDIASFLNFPQAVVAALLIAVGTSLPELFVNMTGVIKGQTRLILGNILGSNIFNILAVVGIAGIIRPIAVEVSTLTFLIPVMLIFSFLLFVFLKRSPKIGRIEGIIFYVLYAIFLFLLFALSR